MRSPLAPVLLLIGIATTAVLALVLVQIIGLRGDLDEARGDLSALRAEVAAQETGVTAAELRRDLDELESGIRDWLIATGADGFTPDPAQPAGAGGSGAAISEQLDEILERIDALDARIDELCEGVPIC